ncbi:TPA: SGNH/GDSL hydrolase family protein [Klebsiella michiganensis]|nr:SGNH/GDSL hydrolase family protein [Klebsiella michiganensis]
MSELTPPLGTAGFSVLKENVENLDIALNTDSESWLDRGKRVNVSWKGILNKNAEALKETQDSITILGQPFTTLAEAQAAANDGKIPVGAVTWVRNAGDVSLADEYINNGGNLAPTGRSMPSQESVDFTLSSAGQLPSAIMTREEIYASVERYGQWTRTDTNGWAVGVKSSGKPVNSLALWLNNLSEISTLSVSVYHRTVDGFSVLPGAATDKLLSSQSVASEDVAITQALAQGYQLVRLTVPDVLLKSDEIILFVVKALDATGNPVYMGCGRAPVESGQVSDLNNSLGGYWLDVAQTTWKTITSADSLYRLAYRVGYFSTAANDYQAVVLSRNTVAEITGNSSNYATSSASPAGQFYGWAIGFKSVAAPFDLITLYHNNLDAVGYIDYRIVLRELTYGNAAQPLGTLATDREVYASRKLSPSQGNSLFTAVDYPAPGLVVPEGYFAVIELHPFSWDGETADMGCQAHTYDAASLPTDIGRGYFVNRRDNVWRVLTDSTNGVAYKLSLAEWGDIPQGVEKAQGEISTLNSLVVQTSQTVAEMNTYEMETSFEKASDNLQWSYASMAESARFWRWAVPVPAEASELKSIAMWLDGISLNTILQCDVYFRLASNQTNTSGPGAVSGDILALTANVTPLPANTAMTEITLPVDRLAVPAGYFPIVAVTAYYSAGVSGNLGSGSKSYSAGDNPATYLKGWYQRFDRTGWQTIPAGTYAAVAVSAVLVTAQDLQEKIASLESGSDVTADYSGDSIDRYAPQVAATGLTAAITGNAIIRGSAKPLSGTLTFDATTVGSTTVASSLVQASAAAQWPSNPNAWLGEKRISNVIVTNTATGTALTPGTHYNVDSYGGKLRGLTATTYAVSVAFTYTRERYDLIQIDPASLAMSVKKGTERAFDVQEYRPAPDAGKVALYYVLVAGNTLEFDPVHRYVDLGGEMLDGKDYGVLRQHNRRCLQKTLARLNRGQAITLAGHGDSITAVSNINSPATTPNGTTRDLQRFLQGGYGSDTLTDLYPAQDWGDGGGAVHVSIGWNRVLKKHFEDVYGSEVTYYNFGMSGTTSASGAGSDRLGAITALSPHLTVVGFGMNDNAGSTLYGNLMTIISTLKAAGSDVVLMPVPRTSNTEDGRYTQDQTRYMNRQVYRAAIDGGAAYAPADWLTDDNSKGGMGIATTSLTGSDLRNHPGGYEMSIYGKALVNVFC